MRFVNALFVASLAAAVIVGGFWVGGFDFEKRGEIALACYSVSVMVFGYFFAMYMSFSAMK